MKRGRFQLDKKTVGVKKQRISIFKEGKKDISGSVLRQRAWYVFGIYTRGEGGKQLQLSVGEVVTSTVGFDRKTINC